MGEASGEMRKILSGEIAEKLENVKKLSGCVLDQSRSIRDFFLGERPKIAKDDSRGTEGAGYFGRVKNDLDDIHRFLAEGMDNLIAVARETDVYRAKIPERSGRRD